MFPVTSRKRAKICVSDFINALASHSIFFYNSVGQASTLTLPLGLMNPRVERRKNKSISTTENTTKKHTAYREYAKNTLPAPTEKYIATDDHEMSVEYLGGTTEQMTN
jgi:hypothetical protein